MGTSMSIVGELRGSALGSVRVGRRSLVSNAVGSLRGAIARLRLRVVAAWQSADLDDQLAAGIEPQTSALFATRAQMLTSRHHRRRIADALSRSRRRAQRPAGFTAAVRPNAPELLVSEAVLTAIDARLRSADPAAPAGMAILQRLLTDPRSSLYGPALPGILASDLRAASAALGGSAPPRPEWSGAGTGSQIECPGASISDARTARTAR